MSEKLHIPFNPQGCSQEQRLWVRRRDSDSMQHPANCRCQFHTYSGETMRQCDKTLDKGKVEIHHIVPKGEEKTAIKAGKKPPYGAGENPYNLIALCAGDAKSIGHHDLMSPQMIIAKQTYAYDKYSYQRALDLVHDSAEQGTPLYNHEWDATLKMIARARTDLFLRRFPNDKFPYTRNPEGHTSLPNNATIFDGGRKSA